MGMLILELGIAQIQKWKLKELTTAFLIHPDYPFDYSEKRHSMDLKNKQV